MLAGDGALGLPDGGGGRRVLVVDDDPGIARLVDRTCDLVLADMRMPVMDG